MKLVITGASGQLARRAAELVLEAVAPEDLILTTRTPAALAPFAARGVDGALRGFRAPESLRAAFAGGERLLLVSATDLEHRIEQHQAAIDAAKAAGVRHVIYTSGLKPEPPNPAVVAPSHYATEQALDAERPRVDDPAQQPLCRLPATRSRARDRERRARAQPRARAPSRTSRARIAQPRPRPCCCRPGTSAPSTRSPGSETFTADELAALYAEIGRRPVRAQALDDAEFVATLIGDATGDDHLRYGAELVASFGRSIREGYMDSCTDDVARLTGRAPLTLAQVLAPLERRG